MSMKNTRVRKAVIPAAGLGTRFLPATKALPKEMLPIVDKPAIQFIVEEAVSSGIKDILIITGRSKRAIEDHFDRSGELEHLLEVRGQRDRLEQMESISHLARIHYIRQKEPMGLGDAVLHARTFVGEEPFALLLGDDIVETPVGMPPCTRQLIEQYEQMGDPVIGVQTVGAEDVSKYGVVRSVKRTVRSGEIVPLFDLVEKPSLDEAPSRIAIMGRYILEPSLFDVLEQTPRGLKGEVQLTDALQYWKETIAMWAFGFTGTRFDVGHPLGFLEANLAFGLQDPALRARLLPMMERMVLRHHPSERGKAL
ncbi:UTP--glucose-1-phosphate uridylyltransferase GalU [Desmospora profundinema]|uniref:UTP--glucose-1-phosphate uridylyltransferase n=1 Tax=Desmospora profundinema TaxID=1571184 RepID=A0ABU1IJH7_9BACL|nr:UTP--glucose-1-phosphate uridylyltransferase GalU [Desmospora profundinema]MDR6224922.1 UTP--glucose-1-phosphate uridylyltransferase [Desmospora profundinema]